MLSNRFLAWAVPHQMSAVITEDEIIDTLLM